MKLKLYLALFFGVSLLSSCSEEIVELTSPIENKGNVILTASFNETKASVTSRGEFYWNSGDEIDVYTSGSRFQHFDILSGVGTKTAEFSGDLGDDEVVSTIAVYPATLSPEVNEGVLSINLPSEYELEEDNLFSQMPMMASISGDGKAVFNHLGGMLRFSFVGIPEEATKLSISADKNLSGTFTVSDGVLVADETSSSDEVVVNLGRSYNERDIVVNIPIPSGKYDKILIKFLDESGNSVYDKTSSKSRTIAVGEMYSFSTIHITHPTVDLGLPSGTLWAAYNVGANSPEEYGDYFSFGETSTKSYFSSSTYTFTKKMNDGDILELEDDAAYVNWGEEWRMPTKDEWQELIDNCTSVKTSYRGVSGWMLTGPNGMTLFFPNAGMYYSDNDDWLIGTAGRYLTSTSCSWGCYVGELYPDPNIDQSSAAYGQTIRAVSAATDAVTLTKNLNLEAGDTRTLNLTNASGSVVWSSLDESVATVSQDGVVTAVAEGKTEIRATMGSVIRSCEVTVVQRPKIVFTEAYRSGIFMNGYVWKGSSIAWSLKNSSSVVANIVSVQIVDYATSYYSNVMEANATIFAQESTGYVVTFGKDTPMTAVVIFAIEYKGHIFEYKVNVSK